MPSRRPPAPCWQTPQETQYNGAYRLHRNATMKCIKWMGRGAGGNALAGRALCAVATGEEPGLQSDGGALSVSRDRGHDCRFQRALCSVDESLSVCRARPELSLDG